MIMHILTISSSQASYPIIIGQNLLTNAELFIRYIHAQQVAIITDTNVSTYYLPRLIQTLADKTVTTLILPAGEQNKTLATVSTIFDTLLEQKHNRSTTLIALGGGVVGDMAGFAAACYQRGVNFIQVPTTLLAQVDASIGGKTAVNHVLGKNMIGAFHQPQAVIIDTGTLKTLPRRELVAGLAEIIKIAVISDIDFFEWLEAHLSALLALDESALVYAISRACEIKASFVSDDIHDTLGQRALLNFGHTFGHALEQLTHYQLLHGEAVAIGMMLACQLAVKQGELEPQVLQRLQTLLVRADLPTVLPVDISMKDLLSAMQYDKKNTDEGLSFILLSAIGKAYQKNITTAMLQNQISSL
jgi:3-dehydroquinate synthase